jgi:ribose 5-phosphate isomerase B
LKIGIGADWVAYSHKQEIIKTLKTLDYEVVDFGGSSEEMNDYPDYAEAVGLAVVDGQVDLGVLICGTGIGMSIAANKIRGVRAALCHDAFTAARSREHNDANVLAMGAWVVSVPHAIELVQVWLGASYEGGRHVPRLKKIRHLEDGGKS